MPLSGTHTPSTEQINLDSGKGGGGTVSDMECEGAPGLV